MQRADVLCLDPEGWRAPHRPRAHDPQGQVFFGARYLVEIAPGRRFDGIFEHANGLAHGLHCVTDFKGRKIDSRIVLSVLFDLCAEAAESLYKK